MCSRKVHLRDGWTTDPSYQQLYQSDREIVETLELLQLEGAAALLDSGCGNGELSLQACRAFPSLAIYGYDALESAIVEARKRASGLERRRWRFDVAWSDHLPLADAAVDRALFRNVLHHVDRPQGVYRELARCLQADGLLVLQAPINRWEAAFSTFLSELHFLMDNSHRRYYYTLPAIRHGLEGSDFSVVTASVSPYPFPFVTEAMKDLILRHGFQERLQLEQVSTTKWSVTLYSARLKAMRRT